MNISLKRAGQIHRKEPSCDESGLIVSYCFTSAQQWARQGSLTLASRPVPSLHRATIAHFAADFLPLGSPGKKH